MTERDYGWHKVAVQIRTENRNEKKKKVLKETEKRNTQKDESGRKIRTEIFMG